MSNIANYSTSLINEDAIGVWYPGSNVRDFPNVKSCIEAVKRGDASCTVIPTVMLDKLRRTVSIDGLNIGDLPKTVELSCWMNRGNGELLEIIDKAIVNSSEGFTSRLYTQYSEQSDESAFANFIVRNETVIIAVAVVLACVIIASLVWSLRRARAAQAEAQTANAAKTAFLARMSHDIRTPLNGIMGLIEVNELHSDDIELMRSNRAKEKIAADHLLTLVNDILEMSKIENRAIELENKPFNLIDVCHDVLVMGRLRASEMGVTIVDDGGRGITYPNLYGSPLHVRRVVLNLIDNSVKYNKPGGSVRCSSDVVSVQGDVVTYRFTVSDTGIGMSEEFLEHIFEPFSQAADDARSTFQGTGMGMPIVKALVEEMGGTIDVQSTLGEGTTFTLTVPFTIDRKPAAHAVPAHSSAEGSISGLNILLAEDNDLNAEIATELLRSEGAFVTRAVDGQDVVNTFISKPAGTFDAILMDVMMPKKNGYEATKLIRLSLKPDASSVPMIAMTANAFAEDAKEAKEAGMNDHLSKPVDIEVVTSTLYKYCKK